MQRIKKYLSEFPQPPQQNRTISHPDEEQPNQRFFGQRSKSQQQPYRRNRFVPPAQEASDFVIRQADQLDNNRCVVFSEECKLSHLTYRVEISTTPAQEVLIAAFDLASPESLLIQLEKDRAEGVLAEFDNDYKVLARYLKVVNKRLVLLNPVSFSLDNLLQKTVGKLPEKQ